MDGPGAFATRGQAHGLIFDQFSNGEAVMGFDQIEIVERQASITEGLSPRFLATVEHQNIALAHRQIVINMCGSTEDYCLGHRERCFYIAQYYGGGAVRDERAIGAL